MKQTVLHLVDDQTPGGITRFLDHLETLRDLEAHWHQDRIVIERGRWNAPSLHADVIVSHLSISWRNLPMLLGLRAKHPTTPILHVEHTYTAGFMALEVRHKQRFKTLLRTAYALFDHVVAVSAAQHAWLAEQELVRGGRHSVLSPSVDLSPFLAIDPPMQERMSIGVIGRLDAAKGVDTVIRAFKDAAPATATLTVYGDGDELNQLKSQAAGDPRIRFGGHVDPTRAMRSCDVVAMPSRRESYGLVALEARAAGRLLLVSGVDGLADHTRKGAVCVGQEETDWRQAFARLSLLQQSHTGDKLRAMAIEEARQSNMGWRALLDSFSNNVAEQMAA